MARWLLGSVCALLVYSSSLPAAAQQTQQIFGFILDQAAREIQRQEFRQQRRQQFLASWQACFQGNISACDQALSFPNLNGSDRSRLMSQRRAIIAANRQAEAQAERRRLEALAQEQQRQQEDEHRESELARQRMEAESLRRQREEAENLRRQREEAESLRRQRETEQQRLAELRTYAHDRDACRHYDIGACHRALSSLHAGSDVVDLRNWRDIIQRYLTDRNHCQNGSLSACDAALASPALASVDRDRVSQWRLAAHPWHRTLAAISGAFSAGLELPASTQIVGGIAMLLAFALVGVAYRRRPTEASKASHAQGSEAAPPQVAGSNETQTTPQTTALGSWRRPFEAIISPPSKVAQAPASAVPEASRVQPAPPPPATRDTPAALAAMELALAYITEINQAPRPAHDDRALRRDHLNTLSLVAKQLDLAQTNDPDAMLEVAGADAVTLRLSVAELMAQALILEGMTHQTYDTKRAVPALARATALDPENPTAFHILGLVQAANMNRSEAVAALQKAVDLDPTNLDYRKELNRAQSLTSGEVAAYKVTRAGERVFDAGIKAWNIFAVTYNVITFPMRMVMRLFNFITRLA